tara:strand:- start:55 stop:465 length:411 start_codon:yes stop_codon:yes gene_type:complete
MKLLLLLLFLLFQYYNLLSKPILQFSDKSYYLEEAETYQEKKRGLMYRDFLPENGGMLFVYDKPKIISMWMINTFVSLDIIWLDEFFKITHLISNPKLNSREILFSPLLSQYVLELPLGVISERQLTINQTLKIKF